MNCWGKGEWEENRRLWILGYPVIIVGTIGPVIWISTFPIWAFWFKFGKSPTQPQDPSDNFLEINK